MLYSESAKAYIPRLGIGAMTLLLANVAISRGSLRIAAAGSRACAGVRLSNPMGTYRPFPRSTFFA